jgi:hypothetical protein
MIRSIKSRRMMWAGHVKGMGEKRDIYNCRKSRGKETTWKAKM